MEIVEDLDIPVTISPMSPTATHESDQNGTGDMKTSKA